MNQKKAEKIWNRLHENRKLEVENIWTRSVFLGAFITLALTGYAIFFSSTFLRHGRWGGALENGYEVHLIGMILAAIILVLGLLWVAMAKGSKYWSEIYEKKIGLLEDKIFLKRRNEWQFRYYEESYLCHDNEFPRRPLIPDSGFFNLRASPRAPSKINIMIGFFVMILGGGGVLGHFLGLICYVATFFSEKKQMSEIIFFSLVIYTVAILFILLVMNFLWNKLKHDYKPNEKRNASKNTQSISISFNVANINQNDTEKKRGGYGEVEDVKPSEKSSTDKDGRKDGDEAGKTEPQGDNLAQKGDGGVPGGKNVTDSGDQDKGREAGKRGPQEGNPAQEGDGEANQ